MGTRSSAALALRVALALALASHSTTPARSGGRRECSCSGARRLVWCRPSPPSTAVPGRLRLKFATRTHTHTGSGTARKERPLRRIPRSGPYSAPVRTAVRKPAWLSKRAELPEEWAGFFTDDLSADDLQLPLRFHAHQIVPAVLRYNSKQRNTRSPRSARLGSCRGCAPSRSQLRR